MGKELKKRDQIDQKYKWNIEDMFPDESLVEAKMAKIMELTEKFKEYEGHVTESAETLAQALKDNDIEYILKEAVSQQEAGAHILLFAATAWMLFSIIRTETGFVALNEENRRSHKSLHLSLKIRAVALSVLAALSSVAMAADVFLRYYTDNYAQGGPMGDNVDVNLNGVALPIYGWFWLVVLALRLITAAFAIHTAATLSGEVEHKYMLD